MDGSGTETGVCNCVTFAVDPPPDVGNTTLVVTGLPVPRPGNWVSANIGGPPRLLFPLRNGLP